MGEVFNVEMWKCGNMQVWKYGNGNEIWMWRAPLTLPKRRQAQAPASFVFLLDFRDYCAGAVPSSPYPFSLR